MFFRIERRMHTSIKKLNFKNYPTLELLADMETPADRLLPGIALPTYSESRQVLNAHYSFTMPTKNQTEATLLSYNQHVGELMGLDIDGQSNDERREFLGIMSGNSVLENSHPWAYCYGGHQFGHWAGQLGDGRAMSLGSVEYEGNLLEFQLKGAGKTPYSRFSDGLAVLRSSIREYLAAEQMHHLGISTSRSLCLIATGQTVEREILEPGAIVCRVAPCWIRFGNFEIFYAREDYENLKSLADYTIKHHFPNVKEGQYLSFYETVVLNTADMIAGWQSVGFCHGVMNTDNFSILGQTIDYGPFQFMDVYDPLYICNHSDELGRYAFLEQPRIGLWNLVRLAYAIGPLLGQNFEQDLVAIINKYLPRLHEQYYLLMGKKLGFKVTDKDKFEKVIQPLLILLADCKLDYHLFFRSLCYVDFGNLEPTLQKWEKYSVDTEIFGNHKPKLMEWISIWKQEDVDFELMRKSNPKYVLRNHLLQKVIERAERGDAQGINDYLKLIQNPFDEFPEFEQEYAQPVPKSLLGMKCSCSS